MTSFPEGLGDNQYALQAVIGDTDAIVFMSVGESERAARRGKPSRLLPVGLVAPSSETVRSGEYPLSRPLTLVSNGAPSDLARQFIQFCLSPRVIDLIVERDFVTVPNVARVTAMKTVP